MPTFDLLRAQRGVPAVGTSIGAAYRSTGSASSADAADTVGPQLASGGAG